MAPLVGRRTLQWIGVLRAWTSNEALQLVLLHACNERVAMLVDEQMKASHVNNIRLMVL